ncbi:hypothetical protein [Flavobacterium sangjuense]|uniref:Uncharacterized protein n=1 Tax=Flavobacterium sangjuense TaxID=2518177 RepID=A0A4P7PTD5_9FLAO|nr:hypothetical protein [Flavobacterium sangjuense]QBZ98217.1 hypothetical protein GS03_01722 [Flavobacterium sangjuense]
MKSRILFSIVFLMLFISCKKETVTPTKVIEKPMKSPSSNECYAYDLKGDKIELQLHYMSDSDSVTGKLNFAFAEKDNNNGFIIGKLTDQILIADYTFRSEGKTSKRQVAFELKDDKAILGYGEMDQDGTFFKDINKVKFDSGVQLTKTDCSTSHDN